MNNNTTEKQLLHFVSQITKLSEIEFLGLARMLNIPLVQQDEDKTPRQFEYIMSDLIDKYISLSKTQKKNLKKILHTALKDKR